MKNIVFQYLLLQVYWTINSSTNRVSTTFHSKFFFTRLIVVEYAQLQRKKKTKVIIIYQIT